MAGKIWNLQSGAQLGALDRSKCPPEYPEPMEERYRLSPTGYVYWIGGDEAYDTKGEAIASLWDHRDRIVADTLARVSAKAREMSTAEFYAWLESGEVELG